MADFSGSVIPPQNTIFRQIDTLAGAVVLPTNIEYEIIVAPRQPIFKGLFNGQWIYTVGAPTVGAQFVTIVGFREQG